MHNALAMMWSASVHIKTTTKAFEDPLILTTKPHQYLFENKIDAVVEMTKLLA